MALHIITDSTSEISLDQARALNLIVVPLTVQFGQQEYVDGVTITPAEFYAKMREVTELPKTSQVNVATFMKVFQSLPTEDEILGIFLSSELSGTFQAARLAAENVVHPNLYLVDSRQVSFGLAALVQLALSRRESGIPVASIIAELNQVKTQLVVLAMIPDLKYLKMGGRLSTASATLGTLMRLRPIVEVRDGKIEMIHKTLGTYKAYEWMAHQLKQANVDDSLPRCYGQADAYEAYEKLRTLVEKINPTYQADAVYPIGITVGTHAGPGSVGLCYFKKA